MSKAEKGLEPVAQWALQGIINYAKATIETNSRDLSDWRADMGAIIDHAKEALAHPPTSESVTDEQAVQELMRLVDAWGLTVSSGASSIKKHEAYEAFVSALRAAIAHSPTQVEPSAHSWTPERDKRIHNAAIEAALYAYEHTDFGHAGKAIRGLKR